MRRPRVRGLERRFESRLLPLFALRTWRLIERRGGTIERDYLEEIGTSFQSDARTRRVPVPRFPYQVIYRLSLTEIIIVAVAHLKRRPNYWKGRT